MRHNYAAKLHCRVVINFDSAPPCISCTYAEYIASEAVDTWPTASRSSSSQSRWLLAALCTFPELVLVLDRTHIHSFPYNLSRRRRPPVTYPPPATRSRPRRNGRTQASKTSQTHQTTSRPDWVHSGVFSTMEELSLTHSHSWRKAWMSSRNRGSRTRTRTWPSRQGQGLSFQGQENDQGLNVQGKGHAISPQRVLKHKDKDHDKD